MKNQHWKTSPPVLVSPPPKLACPTPKNAKDDRALDARISNLTRSLSDLADRHIDFVEGLKPIAPAAWTNSQII